MMKAKWMAVLTVGLLAVHAGSQETAAPATQPAKANAGEVQTLKTQRDRVNYSIGVNVVRNFKQQGLEVDLNLVIRGMRDAFSGEKLLLSEEDLTVAIITLQGELKLKQAELRRKKTQAATMATIENKKEGEAFLAANKAKEGVVTLPSGLQYKILKAGAGKKPAEADSVDCRYRGTLIDGTLFDSSPADGSPATFKVRTLIAGFKEALVLMPAGSKWQLFIPSELAYGARGSGGGIGPNATLLFELELVAIK